MAITLYTKEKTQLPVEFMGFSGGERHIQLGQFNENHFIVRADLRTSNDVFDLLLLSSALDEAFDDVSISLEIPYLPYARQDRVCAPGQAFSLSVFANVLGLLKNVKELVIWDCHSLVGEKLTEAYNVAPEHIIKASPELSQMIMSVDSVIICPDKGAVRRTEAIAKAFENDFQNQPVIYCEKVRDPASGKITHTEVKAEDLSGLTAIITDDICDGGYTFLKIAEQLKAKGAKQIILFVTHGIFSKGLGVFDGLIDHVFTTDSFEHEASPRLTVINYSFHVSK